MLNNYKNSYVPNVPIVVKNSHKKKGRPNPDSLFSVYFINAFSYMLLIAFKSLNAICKRAINASSPFLIQVRGS